MSSQRSGQRCRQRWQVEVAGRGASPTRPRARCGLGAGSARCEPRTRMHEPARCLSVAFFSRTAAVTSAVLPVKSSAPVTKVIIRPKGRPG